MKSLLKRFVIDLLLIIQVATVCIGIGIAIGCSIEIDRSDNKLVEVVQRVRTVPEYSKVEVWYEVPSKGIWLGLLTVDILSGTIEDVKEPMKGYWQGRRRLKAVGYRTGGGTDEIQLCQSMNSNSNSDNK